MPCHFFPKGVMCGFHPVYRLRLLDGRCILVEWHRYLGPTVFLDRAMNREITLWWKDAYICRAIEWFQHRGCKA